jgi:hypothetical protein
MRGTRNSITWATSTLAHIRDFYPKFNEGCTLHRTPFLASEGRNGKTSIRKSVFFRQICEPTREPSRIVSGLNRSGKLARIIIELGMPVQDAFDALLIMNLGWCRLRLFCGGFDPSPSFLFLPYAV